MTLRTGRIDDLTPKEASSSSGHLTAIAKNVQRLTNGKNWPNGVQELLAELGRLTRANVVWIFQLLEITDQHLLMDYPFEWSDKPENAHRSKPRFNILRWDFDKVGPVYNQMLESRKRGEWQSLIVPEMLDCPLKRDLTSQNVKAMLTFPIMVEGEWWGLLGLDDFERTEHWPDADIALLGTAGNLIANAILRDRLASKQRQYEILESITESSAWELDLNTGHLWCSSRVFTNANNDPTNTHMSLYDMLRRVHLQDRMDLIDYLREQIHRRNTAFRKDLRILKDDFEYVWVEIIAKVALRDDGKMQKISGIVIEIPERKAEEELLRHKATIDPLTGIANRGNFEALFAQHVRNFKECGEVLTLLLLDIDLFKNINDTWGHAVGDAALKHITALIQQDLRDTDHPARIGGEEFAILLPGIDAKNAKTIGERIRKDVEANPLKIPTGSIPITISIGASTLTNDIYQGLDVDTNHTTRETLFQLADSALYAAKNSGRNKMVIGE